ncbi:MAG TPA: hypothetical protein VFW69_14045 [Mycobacterium sp.]|nr:hypothetical protein [Mycobacterium sp.]
MTSRLNALVADMPAGIIVMARPDAPNLVDDVIAQARRAHELGVKQVWLLSPLDRSNTADREALWGLTAAL